MQLSELMIGDWVSLFQGKKDGEQCNVKITSLWREITDNSTQITMKWSSTL